MANLKPGWNLLKNVKDDMIMLDLSFKVAQKCQECVTGEYGLIWFQAHQSQKSFSFNC